MFVDNTVCFQKKTIQNKTAMAHTILLVQPGSKPESRNYTDYESVNECMEVPALYYLVATGNNVHTRAVRLQLILFAKAFGTF